MYLVQGGKYCNNQGTHGFCLSTGTLTGTRLGTDHGTQVYCSGLGFPYASFGTCGCAFAYVSYPNPNPHVCELYMHVRSHVYVIPVWFICYILHSDLSLLLLVNAHGSFHCKQAVLLVNM